jgi:hypothetical protein
MKQFRPIICSRDKNPVGFIYIWFDRKKHRYYIGSHAGFIDDGYVCSSTWMLKSYNKRPYDFKRRILELIFDVAVIHIREQYWLDFIKFHELGKRYYNIKRAAMGFKLGDRLSDSHYNAIAAAAARPDVKKKKRIAHLNKPLSLDHRLAISQGQKGKVQTAEHNLNISRSKIGTVASAETRALMSLQRKGRVSNRKGQKMPVAAVEKIREKISDLIWITNGVESKRIFKLQYIPSGWRRGRTLSIEHKKKLLDVIKNQTSEERISRGKKAQITFKERGGRHLLSPAGKLAITEAVTASNKRRSLKGKEVTHEAI